MTNSCIYFSVKTSLFFCFLFLVVSAAVGKHKTLRIKQSQFNRVILLYRFSSSCRGAHSFFFSCNMPGFSPHTFFFSHKLFFSQRKKQVRFVCVCLLNEGLPFRRKFLVFDGFAFFAFIACKDTDGTLAASQCDQVHTRAQFVGMQHVAAHKKHSSCGKREGCAAQETAHTSVQLTHVNRRIRTNGSQTHEIASRAPLSPRRIPLNKLVKRRNCGRHCFHFVPVQVHGLRDLTSRHVRLFLACAQVRRDRKLAFRNAICLHTATQPKLQRLAKKSQHPRLQVVVYLQEGVLLRTPDNPGADVNRKEERSVKRIVREVKQRRRRVFGFDRHHRAQPHIARKGSAQTNIQKTQSPLPEQRVG